MAHSRFGAGATGAGMGALGGAGTGAMVGTYLFPGAGTAVGAAVGAGLGALGGAITGVMDADAQHDMEEALQAEQDKIDKAQKDFDRNVAQSGALAQEVLSQTMTSKNAADQAKADSVMGEAAQAADAAGLIGAEKADYISKERQRTEMALQSTSPQVYQAALAGAEGIRAQEIQKAAMDLQSEQMQSQSELQRIAGQQLPDYSGKFGEVMGSISQIAAAKGMTDAYSDVLGRARGALVDAARTAPPVTITEKGQQLTVEPWQRDYGENVGDAAQSVRDYQAKLGGTTTQAAPTQAPAPTQATTPTPAPTKTMQQRLGRPEDLWWSEELGRPSVEYFSDPSYSAGESYIPHDPSSVDVLGTYSDPGDFTGGTGDFPTSQQVLGVGAKFDPYLFNSLRQQGFGFASGGMAGEAGPELAMLGEEGPELVLNAKQTQQLAQVLGGAKAYKEGGVAGADDKKIPGYEEGGVAGARPWTAADSARLAEIRANDPRYKRNVEFQEKQQRDFYNVSPHGYQWRLDYGDSVPAPEFGAGQDLRREIAQAGEAAQAGDPRYKQWGTPAIGALGRAETFQPFYEQREAELAYTRPEQKDYPQAWRNIGQEAREEKLSQAESRMQDPTLRGGGKFTAPIPPVPYADVPRPDDEMSAEELMEYLRTMQQQIKGAL